MAKERLLKLGYFNLNTPSKKISLVLLLENFNIQSPSSSDLLVVTDALEVLFKAKEVP